MFELDYLTQRLTFARATDTTNPRLIGGYAPTFESERRRAARRDRRAARRRARGVRPGRPRRRPPARRRRRRPLGGRPRRRAADGRPRTPDGRAGPRVSPIVRSAPSPSLLGGSIDLPPNACRHAPARHVRAVDRRARDGRDRGRRRGRQDGPAAGRPVRLARLVGHRGRHRPGGRRVDQRGPLARRRGARASPSSSPTRTRGRPPAGDASTAPRRRARRTSSSSSCPVMLDAASHPDHRSMDAAVAAIAPGLHAGSTGRLRDHAAGRRHARPVRAAPRGGVRARPSRRTCSSRSRRSGCTAAPPFATWRPTRSSSAGSAPASTARAAAFYDSVLDADVVAMSSAEAAEFAKLADTTYRDVNIALANEFARYADRIGVDVARGHRGRQQPAVQPHPPAGARRRRPLHPGLPALPARPRAGARARRARPRRSTTARSTWPSTRWPRTLGGLRRPDGPRPRR